MELFQRANVRCLRGESLFRHAELHSFAFRKFVWIFQLVSSKYMCDHLFYIIIITNSPINGSGIWYIQYIYDKSLRFNMCAEINKMH